MELISQAIIEEGDQNVRMIEPSIVHKMSNCYRIIIIIVIMKPQ